METVEHKCWLCGANGLSDPLDHHHIFGGPYRGKSEHYGLVVLLCHNRCHIFGEYAVHRNKETRNFLRRWGQRKAMEENNWTTAEFVQVFGKNYLED